MARNKYPEATVEMGGAAENCRPEPRGPIYIPADSLHNHKRKGTGIRVRVKFREAPETKVLSIYHQGAYENLGEAYAFIFKYAEDNGYKVAGFSRESYIDGIWNKESVDEWLTEIQLPVE